jgi:site-specific DNA-methyltransferase (adenine-specific)
MSRWPSAGFLQYRHKQAYLLIKGNPDRPRKPIADVRPWEYSGNRAHPTEKAVSILTPLIQAFSKPGDLVLEPVFRVRQHRRCFPFVGPPLHRD